VLYDPTMPAYLDNEPLTGAPTLRALLELAHQRLGGGRRRVVEVRIDDAPIVGEHLDQHLDQPTDSAEVKLITADAVELAVDTLDHAHAQLSVVNDLQQDAAQLLQEDYAAEAFHKLGEAVQCWARVAQAVGQVCHFMGISLDPIQVGEVSAVQLMHDFADKLGRLKQSLTDHDVLGVADALAHEWPPLSKQWSALLDTLIDQIESQSS
jgi:hypothetical protein